MSHVTLLHVLLLFGRWLLLHVPLANREVVIFSFLGQSVFVCMCACVGERVGGFVLVRMCVFFRCIVV